MQELWEVEGHRVFEFYCCTQLIVNSLTSYILNSGKIKTEATILLLRLITFQTYFGHWFSDITENLLLVFKWNIFSDFLHPHSIY